jgi:acyl-CoA synthetase (AMP-forming)/AMP-acid ligase II
MCPSNVEWSDRLRALASERSWLIFPDSPVTSDAHASYSYEYLCRTAHEVANNLYDAGVVAGDRVIIVAENTVEACAALMGALVAGVVIVPIAPRGLSQSRESWQEHIDWDCRRIGAKLLIAKRADLDGFAFSATVRSTTSLIEFSNKPHRLQAWSDTALIQHTSGTTGTGRGAQLTHENLVRNIQAIASTIQIDETDVGLCWLPIFHDMGLIGGLLTAAWCGVPLVMMKPASLFLQPHAWLWAISRFRVTACAAPNSAYQLLASRVPESKFNGLDLSQWRVAISGSEMILAGTMQSFARRFAAYGFRENSLYPLYGLAENTLATTFPRLGDPLKIDLVDGERLERERRAEVARHSNLVRPIVSVGKTWPGQDLRIVSATGARIAADREVGDIEIRGPCVMKGYYGDLTGSQDMFHDGWLRTGDRGYLVEGDLYVTGRSKEVIMHGGRSLDAAYIAGMAAQLPGIHRQGVAVVGMPDAESGTEAIVVMVETSLQSSEHAQLCTSLRHELQQRAGIVPQHVLVVKPGRLPRTTSGKIRHSALVAELRRGAAGYDLVR